MRRQARGWVVRCEGKPHPGAARLPSLRTTPPAEGIFLGAMHSAQRHPQR
jgi:hypothetical protein